jgi:hypothetical protein
LIIHSSVKHSTQEKVTALIVYVDDIVLTGNDDGEIQPIEVNVKLGEDSESPLVDKGRYQHLVGRLIYLSHTYPNIAYVVSVVSQFKHSPREPYMKAVYRILRYLKSSPGKGLLFS